MEIPSGVQLTGFQLDSGPEYVLRVKARSHGWTDTMELLGGC